MPKYNFNESAYAKFWESREAGTLFTKFINDPDIIAQRQHFWKKNFDVDPLLSTRNPDGTALFRTAQRKRSVDNMLDMRAPLGETQTRDKQGMDFYTGPIPDFAAKGFVETAVEREARTKMFESYFGNDAQILMAFADDVQDMVDEANFTMSNLGAQLLSTGKIIYNHGTGIKGNLYKCPIPAENFVSGGEVAWSDPSCKLLDQMEKIEKDFRERTGYQGALKWQITKEVFNNIVLKNAQIIEYINSFRLVNKLPIVEGWSVNDAMFNEAMGLNPKISPIEIVEEAQKDGGTVVHGWASNVAVLRPVGMAGLIKRADILDKDMSQKYGSSVISTVWSQLDIFSLVNTTRNNGRFKEWHTDLLVAAIPTLDEYYDHIIVDISRG